MKWGVWGARFTSDAYDRMVKECLDAGIRTFDHADIYGGYTTEAEFGSVLRSSPSLRDTLQIITKCGICLVDPNRPEHIVKHYETRAPHIRRSVERSLKNLYTDRIDLLLIHRPDPLMDPAEVAKALQDLMQEGKILAAGVSNFSAAQTDLLSQYIPLNAHQLEFSLSHTAPLTNGVLDMCRKQGIVVQAWSPLGGILEARRENTGKKSMIFQVAMNLAETHGATIDQILLAWILHHPLGIRPVIGTSRPERVRASVLAESISLSRQEWFQLYEASLGHEVP